MIKVIHGDFRAEMPKLGNFDFIFADPPFNIGQNYSGYNDCLEEHYYLDMINSLVLLCEQHSKGVVALHGPDWLSHKFHAYAIHHTRLKQIGHIIWHYRVGQCNRSNWINAHCHCLLFSAVEKHTWNPDSVLVQSDRVRYGDTRIMNSQNGGKRLPGTVWGIPSDGKYWGRVPGNSRERIKECPNQLPEVYLERLIKAYTNEGDTILDPFGGSGTTAIVGEALGRVCTTIDVSKKCCEGIQNRWLRGAVRIKK